MGAEFGLCDYRKNLRLFEFHNRRGARGPIHSCFSVVALMSECHGSKLPDRRVVHNCADGIFLSTQGRRLAGLPGGGLAPMTFDR